MMLINIDKIQQVRGKLMSFQSLNYSQPSNRFGLEKSNVDDMRFRQKYRYSPEIRYHLPYQRLSRRKVFSQLIKRYIKEELILKMDNFALFDAVCKRGGYQYVVSRNRWEEINICLQYQKKIWAFLKYYQDNLLAHEFQIMQICGWYKTITYETEVHEMHLITANNLTTSYYHMTANQYMFAQANYFSLDQYFNLKTLALTQADCSKISVDYAEKYIILKKWLLFSGQIKSSAVKELRSLGIQQSMPTRVVIIGISTVTLLIADKLSDFGINVVMLDKGKREGKLKDEFQIVENGLMLLQGGINKGSYYKNLQNNLITLGEVQIPLSGMMVLDQDGKPYSQDKVRSSQENFISIIEQLKGQIMSKKNLYEQVVTRMLRRKLDYQRFLIRWHYDRYMSFNRIKGDGTTVGDLATYESKKFIKHIAQTFSLTLVLSIDKLLARLKQKRNVNFINAHIDYISHQQDIWNIHLRSQTITANHFIYADQQTVFKGVLDGNPKLPEISSEIMGESLSILQQLTVMKYINCLFRFRQKILLKESLKNQTCFSICCAHGFIYFFILNNGTEIMAILKCYHNSNINYYSQILNILESKCLLKNNRFLNEELYAFEYTFGVKDEKYMEAIIRIKQLQKLYLLLPITTTNCPHRMTATIDMANYICSNILDQVYPHYQHYDPSYKQQFLKPQPSVQVQSNPTIKTPQKQQPVDKAKKQIIPNISTLPLLKSKSDQIEKMRFISVIPNQPIESNRFKSVQGQIPSIFALSQLQEDCFGLKHPFVRRYEEFVRMKIQKSGRPKQGLSNIHLMSICEPIMLYPGTYLHSIGSPYLKESEWFSSILSNLLSSSNYIFCLNGLISRRQYISLFDTFRTTIYYQTVLLIQDEVYYCMIDENNPNIKYYHTNLTSLVSALNTKLDILRNEELSGNGKTYANYKVNRCKFDKHPPKELMPSLIAEQIKAELEQTQGITLDQLLQRKLSQTFQRVKYCKYMGSQHQELFTQKNIVQYVDFHQKVYKEIANYLTLITKIYELKPFSLFQVFFGVLDQQYIACQIMKKFTKDPLTYFDLEKLDQPLSKEIQEIFSKNISNEIYSIIIIPEQMNIFFHRNFIDPNRASPFERYTYLRTLQATGHQARIKHYLVDSSNKIQFIKCQDIIKEIIRKLNVRYHQEQIIKHFQNLIHKEIQNEVNLGPRVKMYHRMVKKSIPQFVNHSSMNKFQQKCKGLDEPQKDNAYELMKSKKMRWIDNELIFVVK